MFFLAPLEGGLHADAREDRERLVGGAEVVLVRRDGAFVEPQEERRDVELDALEDVEAGADRHARAVAVREERRDVEVGLRRLVVDESRGEPALRALVERARADGPRVLPAVRKDLSL